VIAEAGMAPEQLSPVTDIAGVWDWLAGFLQESPIKQKEKKKIIMFIIIVLLK
jgi:hypothetical protein